MAGVASSPTHSQENSEIDFVVDPVEIHRLPWKILTNYLETVFGPAIADIQPEVVYCREVGMVF